ncbi:MAG TPA: lanthionine synthetase LanC family protein [Solirubrobacteraceae bacterium]|nr:lanthionine synthetase LanC family protein [Solirubrobacteraceae bacterium]
MRTTVRSIPPPAAASRGADPLATAAGIGDRLVREATWYRGQCNWIALDSDAQTAVQRALGPALGSGTAGVALFLAELCAAGDDRAAIRRTALGAIAQALAHADQVPAHGLYEGRLGIAYAAARCSVLLGEGRLAARAARLARGRLESNTGFDLISGDAGSVAGLLALAHLQGDERLVQRAQRPGDALAGGARRARAGWSWPAHGARSMHGLCGMSRGAAGAAWALLALHSATGQQRHRHSAERALDYERHWFDAEEANWPDLRGIFRREARGAFRAPFECSWAHGAPGIALARLRAWRVLGDERYRNEATIALATTAAYLDRALLTPGADFTLGRGLAGNAEVLLLGADLRPEGAELAQRAGEIAASRHAGGLEGWPCATTGAGLAPGLLDGHAGIGLFYLRLHDRAVPSPLLIG